MKGRNYWRFLLREAGAAWLAWVPLPVVLLLGAYVSALGGPAAVRWGGMAMQLYGIFLVWLGLEDARRVFGRPSTAEMFVAWVRHLAQGPRSITISGTAAVSTTTFGRVDVRVTDPDPLENRLRAIEADIEGLNHRIKDMTDRQAEREERTQQSLQELHRKAERTARLLDAVAVEGLPREVAGLFWLAVGVVCTSVPDELAIALGAVAAGRLTMR